MWFNFLPGSEDFREKPPQIEQITQMRSQKIKTRIIVLSHFLISVLCVICGCILLGCGRRQRFAKKGFPTPFPQKLPSGQLT
jgi:hypothetical protein